MRDLERYARNIRNENRTSISIGTGEPRQDEGNDGDIRINSITSGIYLYAKYQGQWYSRELKKLLNKPEKISPIGVKIPRSVHQGQYSEYAVVEVNNFGGTFDEDDITFENDIVTLAAKLNEIIEKIQ